MEGGGHEINKHLKRFLVLTPNGEERASQGRSQVTLNLVEIKA